MPNPGGPYGGCDACRRRKVKCDQTYPACQRCIKRGAQCPGVRDRRTQVFRDETVKTAAKVGCQELNEESQPMRSQQVAAAPKLSWEGDAAKPASLARSAATDTAIVPLHRYHARSETLPARLAGPQGDILVAFFFDQFTCPNVGWYEHLLPLYRDAAADSYLNTSIQAASLFVLANQRRDDSASLMSKARSTYSDALISLNAAIGDEKERLKDEVLCTVLILNIIEDITGSRDLFCHAHLAGLQRLLRLRKALGIKSLFGAEVWHAVALKLQLLTLQTSKDTPYYSPNRYSDDLLVPQMLVSPTLITHETCDAVRKFRNSVGNILYNAASYPNGYDVDSLSGRFCAGRKLDGILRAWCHEEQGSMLMSRWQRHIAPGYLDENACTNMEYFSSVQAAEVWNQNRCARIYLHQTLLDLADHLLGQKYSSSLDAHTRHNLEATVVGSRRIIDEMLNCICSSIPFNLHKVDSQGRACADQSQRVVGGVGLVWPLEIVLSCPYSSEAHKSLATDALREIGHSIGVRQAFTRHTRVIWRTVY